MRSVMKVQSRLARQEREELLRPVPLISFRNIPESSVYLKAFNSYDEAEHVILGLKLRMKMISIMTNSVIFLL